MRWAPATAGAHLRASGKPPAAAWDPRDAPRPRSGQALLRRPRPGRPRPGPGCTGDGPARTAWSRLHRWRPGPDGLVPAAPVAARTAWSRATTSPATARSAATAGGQPSTTAQTTL